MRADSLLLIGLILSPLLSGCGDQTTPETLLTQARENVARGDLKRAVIELKSALQQEPNLVEARLLLGESLLDQGEIASAIKELERAQNLQSKSPELPALLARAYLADGQFEKVLAQASTDAAGPHAPTLLAVRASALLALNRPDESREALAQALSLDPANQYALLVQALVFINNSQLDKARIVLEGLTKQKPELPSGWLLIAGLDSREGKHSEAAAAYRQVLQFAPSHAMAHIGLVRELLNIGDASSASKEVTTLRKRYPKSAGISYLDALTSFQLGDPKKATDLARYALSLEPTHAPSQLLLARVLFANGAYEQAEEFARAVLTQYPGHPAASKLLAAVSLARNKPDSALKTLTGLDAGEIDDPFTLSMLASSHLSRNELGEGIRLLEKAVIASPNDIVLKTNLATTRLRVGDSERGLRELAEIADSSTGVTAADLQLVSIHLDRGEFDAVLDDVEKLAKKLPDSPAIDNLRGAALAGKGDAEGARNAFESALLKDSTNADAMINLSNLEIQSGRLDDAGKRMEALLRTDPENVAGLTMLGAIRAVTGKAESATEPLERARALDSKALRPRLMLAEIYLERAPQKARAIANEAAKLEPDELEPLVLQIRAALASDDNTAAESLLDTAVKKYAAEPRVLLLAVELHAKRRAFEQAEASLDALLELHPANAAALIAATRLALAERNWALASERLAILKSKHGELYQVHELSGEIASSRGDYKAAVVEFTQALSVSNDELSIAMKLHDALLEAGEPAKAHSVLQDWITNHPGVAHYAAEVALAHGYARSGDYTGAISRFERLLDLSDRDFNALNNLAWLYQQTGDPRALVMAEKAASLYPDNPDVADTLGWILLQSGTSERGARLLAQAAAGAPESGTIRYHNAVALMRSGAHNDALKEVEQALALPGPFAERSEAENLRESLRSR